MAVVLPAPRKPVTTVTGIGTWNVGYEGLVCGRRSWLGELQDPIDSQILKSLHGARRPVDLDAIDLLVAAESEVEAWVVLGAVVDAAVAISPLGRSWSR